MAQRVTHAVLDHALGHARIHHPAERHGESLVAHHVFNPGPKVENGLETRIGPKVLNRAGGRVDDVVDRPRFSFGHDLGFDACIGDSLGQDVFVFGPVGGIGCEENPDHRLRGL